VTKGPSKQVKKWLKKQLTKWSNDQLAKRSSDQVKKWQKKTGNCVAKRPNDHVT